MEELIQALRGIADEMEAGDWEPQEAAVLICRDEEGCLTFCGWGAWAEIPAQAAVTRRATA